MAFTEFCCRSGGSNLNAGTRTGNSTVPGTAANLTYASGTWVSATGVFTVASGNPTSDGVAVGDFASVYADGSTVTTLIGRVTARSATTITVSTTAKSGTTTDGTNTRTLKIGGAWLGPNAADAFPFALLTATPTDGTNLMIRVNLMNDATYSISAGITHNSGNSLTFQGFTTAYGDLGRFLLDGGANAITPLTVSSTGVEIVDFVIANNGASGTGTGLSLTGTGCRARRGVVHDIRGVGINLGGGACKAVECETYLCNTSNTTVMGGIALASGGTETIRCIMHDNAGSNNSGCVISNSQTAGCVDSIFDSNGLYGVFGNTDSSAKFKGCDFYNNGASGAQVNGSNAGNTFESCNFVKNGGYGINGPGASSSSSGPTIATNCGFGSGTQANASGQTNGVNVQATGSVTYASNTSPWVDPDNGDFRINLAAAKGTGRGAFTETQASYAGTIGYPDIGAAHHVDSGGAGMLFIPNLDGV